MSSIEVGDLDGIEESLFSWIFIFKLVMPMAKVTFIIINNSMDYEWFLRLKDE